MQGTDLIEALKTALHKSVFGNFSFYRSHFIILEKI